MVAAISTVHIDATREFAVDYAKLQRTRVVGPSRKIPDQTPQRPRCNEPSDADGESMNSAEVIFANDVYHFGEFRYDKLADLSVRAPDARDGEMTVVRECTV